MNWIDRVSSIASAIDAGWKAVRPDPVEVLRADHGLNVDREWLIAAQAEWCERWRKPVIPQFVIHDACHFLLNQPPTPLGEAVVLAFQSSSLVLDAGIGAAAVGGIFGSLVARRARGSVSRPLRVGLRGARVRVNALARKIRLTKVNNGEQPDGKPKLTLALRGSIV